MEVKRVETMNITIAIGTDHRGFALKEFIKQQTTCGTYTITWDDCGAFDDERSDYPVFAHLVCQRILTDRTSLGVLLCGSGIGMAIAANRFPGIYAGLVWSAQVARLAREDDNCNVISLAADFCDEKLAKKILESWLQAEFKGGRYAERIAMLDD